MRRRYVQIDGQLREVVDGFVMPESAMIQPDIKPYKSMVTGEIIDSRTKHREHLKRYGMREVGNEIKYVTQKPIPDVAPQQRKELIRAQVDDMTDAQFRRAIRRDIDDVKWNSRR